MSVLVLRHGESTANVEGVIVSSPGVRALTEVGLSRRGREQAAEAGRRARDTGLDAGTIVLSSDFARASETAAVFAAELGARGARIDARLRERDFGRFDEGPASAYDGIWAADAAGRSGEHGVEPVASVARRVGAVLAEADALAADGRSVVLVAHGDVLQIALAIGEGRDPHEHREVPHLGNAELRELGPARPVPGDASARP
ncbi:histidine phosphatase family protein [Brachybacterium horti]